MKSLIFLVALVFSFETFASETQFTGKPAQELYRMLKRNPSLVTGVGGGGSTDMNGNTSYFETYQLQTPISNLECSKTTTEDAKGTKKISFSCRVENK